MKKKIFIVDDHPIVREGLARLINQQKDLMVVGEAAEAAEALLKMGLNLGRQLGKNLALPVLSAEAPFIGASQTVLKARVRSAREGI